MAIELLSDIIVIELINKVLKSANTGLEVYKFTALDKPHPITDISGTSTNIESFDIGGGGSIQTTIVNVITTNRGRDEKQAYDIQNKLYNAIHQKIDAFNTAGNNNWLFYSCEIKEVNSVQLIDEDNPGTAITLNIRIVAEWIGNI